MSCEWFAALQGAGILSWHIGPKNNSTLKTHTGGPVDFRSGGGCGTARPASPVGDGGQRDMHLVPAVHSASRD